MRIFIVSLSLTAVLLCAPVFSQSSAEADIHYLVAQYLETRAQNDEQALRALLTEDVDQLTTSGELRSGIDDVSLGSLATSDRTGGERSITVEHIRFLRPDLAIVTGRYDIVGRDDGSDRHYLTTMVVINDNDSWKISAIRNMQPTR